MTNSNPSSIVFLVKNDGRSEGVVSFINFRFRNKWPPGLPAVEKIFPIDQLANKGVLLTAGSTTSITITAPAGEFEQFCSKITVSPPPMGPMEEPFTMPIPYSMRSLIIYLGLTSVDCGFDFSETSFYGTADRRISVSCDHIRMVSDCLSKLYDQKLKWSYD